jgi:YVTN family beta-propeller protein
MRSTLLLKLSLIPLTALWLTGCPEDDDDGAQDMGVADNGVKPDTGVDTGVVDMGVEDTGVEDTGADTGVDTGVEDTGVDGGVDAGFVVSTRPRNGSAVAVTADDGVGLFINRRTGFNGTAASNQIESYTLNLAASPPTMTMKGTFLLEDAYQIIIGNDDDSAYVAGRTEVVKFTGVKSTAGLTRNAGVAAGSESRGIALSPTGQTLYVANWADGTVTVIRTADMTVTATIDLNGPLATSGLLGDSVTGGRPGLAHPYAIGLTNDGDMEDGDETVYVTEYFSQAITSGVPTDNSGFDLGRQGVIYQFNAGTQTVGALITLAPTADTTFVDSDGNATGCFPNQLNAVAINGERMFVTGVCASPRGPTGPILDANNALMNPANFKTEVHAAVYVVNTTTNMEEAANSLLLTAQFQALYDTAAVPDDGTNRRIPLIPTDIAFVPGSNFAYVTSYGSDAVFRIAYNADGTLDEVGSSTQRFINLVPQGQDPGRLPIGIGMVSGGRAIVANEFTRNVSFLQFSTQNVVGTANLTGTGPTGAEANINNGRRFFVTGLGRWSFRAQGWNSCEACHPNGLTDNVTWFFARGPRQTTSLDGTYSSMDPAQRRLLNWTAIFDETHDFELNTRGNSGGVGAIVHANSNPPVAADRIHFDGTVPVPAGNMATLTPQNGLNGSTISMMPGGANPVLSVLEDWNLIEAYVRVIRSPRAPSILDAGDVAAGRQLFVDNNCAGCHATEMWTISRVFYTPNEANNNPTTGALRSNNYTADNAFPAALNPPSNVGGRMAPLRFNGANPGANDQINCILRAVGTFPDVLDGMQNGVAPTGVRVREVRTNMTTDAQGLSGFNPPSLLGMGTGAPYFHAGNARTLEEVFATPTFDDHSQAFSSNFPGVANREMAVRQLTAFLLSIDETTVPEAVPTTLGFDATLCPDSFP